MKTIKHLAAMAAIALTTVLGLASCNNEEPTPTPDKKLTPEQKMITINQTYQCDSVVVIEMQDELITDMYTVDPAAAKNNLSYTFYTYDYQFPSDMTFKNQLTGYTSTYREAYNEPYCKYECHAADGTFLHAGYVKNYDGKFTLNGTKSDGMINVVLFDVVSRDEQHIVFDEYHLKNDEGITYYFRQYYSAEVK